VAGTRTSRIDLGVGIVPTYPRHPLALAQQAATAQAFCGGRLTLGVGVSHRPVIEDLHGLAYQHPAAHMRDYLSVLVPLLREGSVCYRGNFYEVDGGFTVPGTSPVSVLVGALSPLMVQAAGELADGVVTWLAGPRTLGEQIVPQLHRSAAGQAESGAAPRVVAALPVALSADGAASRQAADGVFARYAGFDNYRRPAGPRGRGVAGRPGRHRGRGRDREAARAAGRRRRDRAVAHHLPGGRRPRPQPARDQGVPARPGHRLLTRPAGAPILAVRPDKSGPVI
jgi:F420-dependent oxidoreductase-like protein